MEEDVFGTFLDTFVFSVTGACLAAAASFGLATKLALGFFLAADLDTALAAFTLLDVFLTALAFFLVELAFTLAVDLLADFPVFLADVFLPGDFFEAVFLAA